MINKSYTFNDEVVLDFNEKRFSIYLVKDSKKFSIFYDISMNKFSHDRLEMNVTRETKTINCHKISILKTDKAVVEIYVQALNLDGDTLQRYKTTFNKIIRVFADFKFQIIGEFVEVVYKYGDGTRHTVFVNIESNIHGVRNWLSGIWPLRGLCRELYIMIEDGVVNEPQSFSEYKEKGRINLDVTERCYISPLTNDSSPVALPWNKKIPTMIQRLSEFLGVEVGIIELVDKDGNKLTEKAEVNIEDFRLNNTDPPRLFFDLIGAKIRCVSMRNDQDFTELTALNGDRTVAEVKRRLAYKFHTDVRRLIICRANTVLPTNEIAPMDQDLKYCIGKSQANIVVKEKIGQGSYGLVYRFTEGSSTTEYALKELMTHKSNQATKGTEIAILTTVIEHVNIVRYLDLYIDNEDISLAMEYLPAGSLHKYLKDRGPLNESTIRSLSHNILTGLQHLHNIKIMHRDIKSPNVLLGEPLVAKLCDFGLSKILINYKTAQLSEGMKRTAEIGSINWMAPEVINGENYSFKIDVWSVGATVIEMITGKEPYHGREENNIMYSIGQHKVIMYDPPHPISVQLKELVDCCLTPLALERPNVRSVLSLPFFNDVDVR